MPLPNHQRAYVLSDGTAIVVDRDTELPEPVMAAMTEIGNGFGVHTDPSDYSFYERTDEAIGEITRLTGKSVVLITQDVGAAGCPGPQTTIYAAKVGQGWISTTDCAAFATPEESYADAVAAVALRTDAERFVIIPFTADAP